MRIAGRFQLAALTALAVCLLFAPPSPAAETWQPSPSFYIPPAQVPGFSPDGDRIYYRLTDGDGNQVEDLRTRAPNDPFETFTVPPIPGAYFLEAWLQDADGQEVRRGSMTLRFDNVPPPAPDPKAPSRWLLATEPALLEIGQPTGPFPLSGIRGYAVSVDRGEGSAPCGSGGLCGAVETDLPGGIEDDTISLGTLPEGTSYARVVTVSGSGVASAVRTAVFKVDATLPRLSLLGLPAGWSARPVKLTTRAEDSLSGMAAAGPDGPYTAIAVDGGASTTAVGDSASAWVGGSGVHSVAFYARDAAGNVADGSPGHPNPETARVRIDEDPPRLEFAAAQDPDDPERIEALVADSLSGPDPTRGEIALRLAGTRGRYEPLPTRVDGNRLVAHWSSDDYPAGKYEFLATGFDRAGNAASGTERAWGGRMVLVNPVKAPVSLAAKLSRLELSGRLRRFGGGPLAGQAVTVAETFAAGAAPARRSSVVHTRGDGTFALRLEPGPSREVSVTFAGTRLLSRATGTVATVDAKARVRLRASAPRAVIGGRPIVFKGKVATKGTTAGAVAGLPVELQFRYPGAPWSEFRTVEADAHGRFRYPYRFSDDDSRGVRFQFRAYAKSREGWPYEPSASRPVSVTGR